jgi:hypothetical protein
MKLVFRRVSLAFASLAVALAFASPVLAAQSALVGKQKADGSVQLYLNRFLDHFADGTPVAKIEAAQKDGATQLIRRSADGCQVEISEATIGPLGPDGSRPIWQVTANPLSLFRCRDNGCAEEFTEGAWTASCGDFGSVEPYVIHCICIRKNFDQVIGEEGDWCKRGLTSTSVWDLHSWILSQFIQ